MSEANTPAKVWIMNAERVRKGLGPLPIDQLKPAFLSNDTQRELFGYYGRSSERFGRIALYRLEFCYLTEKAAKHAAIEIAKEEIAKERGKFDRLIDRISTSIRVCS